MLQTPAVITDPPALLCARLVDMVFQATNLSAQSSCSLKAILCIYIQLCPLKRPVGVFNIFLCLYIWTHKSPYNNNPKKPPPIPARPCTLPASRDCALITGSVLSLISSKPRLLLHTNPIICALPDHPSRHQPIRRRPLMSEKSIIQSKTLESSFAFIHKR